MNMDKKLLVGVLALLLGTAQTEAQGLQKDASRDVTQAVVNAYVEQPAIIPAENQMWYGYNKGTEPLSGMGIMVESDINEMIRLFGTDPVVRGKTIKAIRFRVQGVSDLTNFTVWLSAQAPYPADEGHIVDVDVDESTLKDTIWNEVALPEGYAVPDTGVYVGYSFHTAATTNESRYPIITTADGVSTDGALYDWEEAFMSGWQSYPDGRMGKLAIQVLLEGDFQQNSASVADFGDHIAIAGGKADIALSLVNFGKRGIESFDYTVATNGVAGDERHFDMSETFDILGGTVQVTLPMEADADCAKAEKAIAITKVNGQPNEATTETTASGTLLTLAKASPRRVLMEEYTGTWCGWCPRGIVGIRRLRADFGDAFIPVSVHTQDPMTILAYQALYNNVYSYPEGILDRHVEGDPYAGSGRTVYGVKADVESELAIPTEASLDLAARWANAEKTRITATTSLRFQYHADSAPYGLAYVVVADSLRGDSTGWVQRNFYYYFTDDPDYAEGSEMHDDFKEYLNAGTEYMTGFTYNDVAIAAYGIESGQPGSVPAPIVVDEEKTRDFTISIANNPLVQDKKNLRVVAMLIDQTTGRVVNAAESVISDGSTGVAQVDAAGEKHEVARFALDGRRVLRSQKGFVVIKYSDGTTRKAVAR